MKHKSVALFLLFSLLLLAVTQTESKAPSKKDSRTNKQGKSKETEEKIETLLGENDQKKNLDKLPLWAVDGNVQLQESDGTVKETPLNELMENLKEQERWKQVVSIRKQGMRSIINYW